MVEILLLGYLRAIYVYEDSISSKSHCKKRGVTVKIGNYKNQIIFWSENGRSICKIPQFILCSADLWSLINDVELVVLDLLHRRLIPTSHVPQYIASSCTCYQLNSSLAKSFHDHGGNIPIRYHIPLINVIPSIPPTFSQSNLIQCWEPPTSLGVREIKHPVAMGCHITGGIGV